MDNRLTPDQENSLLEDALKTYPLASMPRDITSNVMARIKKDSRLVLFTWNDIAISIVVLFCAGALFFTIQNLPPIMVMEIRKQSILAYQSFLVNSRWLVPSIFFDLAAFFAALTIPYLGRQLNKS